MVSGADQEAPGLKRRARANGEVWYWVARDAPGYPIKTIRLTEPTHEERAARCRLLQAELEEWRGAAKRTLTFDGTIGSIIDSYLRDADSPYRSLRENTRRSYDLDLRILRGTCGPRHVAGLNRKDFARWHASFKEPATPGSPERIRLAHGLMVMLRMLFGYGKSMRYAGCRECVEVLEEMRFEQPAKRQVTMTFAQAAAVVDGAIAAGRRSIALGQAIQFELAMRQIDVIGYWVKAAAGEVGIIRCGKRWTGGLTWSDFGPDLKLTKITTKTGSEGQWDPALCPLIMKVLAAIPADQRMGPVIKDEDTGAPFLPWRYARLWRGIADAAGVPKNVWNRDSRSGGLTEGADAGASKEDLQRLATHSSPQTTDRYIRKGMAASSRVAKLRVAYREGQGED